MSEPLILGIETSCDETGVGIVRGRTLLANVIASSMEEHARYGGVVPEVAARAHLEAISPTIEAALAEAGVAFDDLDGHTWEIVWRHPSPAQGWAGDGSPARTPRRAMNGQRDRALGTLALTLRRRRLYTCGSAGGAGSDRASPRRPLNSPTSRIP